MLFVVLVVVPGISDAMTHEHFLDVENPTALLCDLVSGLGSKGLGKVRSEASSDGRT